MRTLIKALSPCLYCGSQLRRAYSVKNNKDLRDANGAMILPLLTIERTSMTKELSRKGTAFGNMPPVDDYKGGTFRNC
jgi:hypothetical protein